MTTLFDDAPNGPGVDRTADPAADRSRERAERAARAAKAAGVAAPGAALAEAVAV